MGQHRTSFVGIATVGSLPNFSREHLPIFLDVRLFAIFERGSTKRQAEAAGRSKAQTEIYFLQLPIRNRDLSLRLGDAG